MCVTSDIISKIQFGMHSQVAGKYDLFLSGFNFEVIAIN